MKSKSINLHMNQKRALCLVAFFSLIALWLNVVLGIALDQDNSQLNALLSSDYEYSVTTRGPIGKDDYYQFEAGISFFLAEDSVTSINADVVMQVEASNYSNLLNWNASRLNEDEVAISNGIARAYGLNNGDVIYSKHIVNGGVNKYKVVQILPEGNAIRTEKMKSHKKGILIMGCDNIYVENLSHKFISFTNNPIQELEASYPENILYREDEIAIVVKRMLPYVLAFSIIITIMVCGQAMVATKGIKHNFKRLATLGFEEKKLNCAYMRLLYGIGITSLLVSFVCSLMAYKIMRLCFYGIWISMVLTVLGLAALMVVKHILNRRLWRE